MKEGDRDLRLRATCSRKATLATTCGLDEVDDPEEEDDDVAFASLD